MPQDTTRLNKFIALHLGVSRRGADELIEKGEVKVDGLPARPGQQVTDMQTVTVQGKALSATTDLVYVALHKPVGYVCSRREQGLAPTIYSLLPPELHHLKPVGRLDRDSSGLILLTNDGDFAHTMTHPKFAKSKIYEIEINKVLTEGDFEKITKAGVDIDGVKLSRFQLAASSEQQVVSEAAAKNPCYFLPSTHYWQATLAEGRNRQIRRTFEALGYHVLGLHRLVLDNYVLDAKLKAGQWRKVNKK